eukprot:7271944-Alexandrium_andersonii.AAC.1
MAPEAVLNNAPEGLGPREALGGPEGGRPVPPRARSSSAARIFLRAGAGAPRSCAFFSMPRGRPG